MNQEQLSHLSKNQLLDYLKANGVRASKSMKIRELIRIALGGQSDAQIKSQIKAELLEEDDFELPQTTLNRIQEKYTLSRDKQNELSPKKLAEYTLLRNQIINLLKKLNRAADEYNERAHLEPDNMKLLWRIEITRQVFISTEIKLKKLMGNDAGLRFGEPM